MGESMSLYRPDAYSSSDSAPRAVAGAAWHALFWLVVANAIGVLIAILLLFPALNRLLGEWTYGRWIMVHLNLELYGWMSLPLAGFLFKVYGADRGPLAQWSRPVLWVWSAALGVGAYSWLTGHSSGKLFLDWSGYARILFPLAMAALWLLLAASLAHGWKTAANTTIAARSAKLLGLALLLIVPFVIYIASSPNFYPPINPDSGGPTGASQLESSLMIVAVLLLLPFGLTQRKAEGKRIIAIAWIIMVAEFLLCLALGRADISHHRPAQFVSLGSLLIWVPLISAYYEAFHWHANTRRWRIAFLAWWTALIISGWVLFLPGVLDHFKFTDGLVGHSLLAMAGFTSSLLIFVLVQLLGEDGWIFNGTRSFYGWNIGVLGYVVLMSVAGWREGFDPTFTIVPGVARNMIYILRLVVGVVMLASSLDWLNDATALLRKPAFVSIPAHLQEEVAA
jgi:cytochrome c oxidase cbb3-type subunit 1